MVRRRLADFLSGAVSQRLLPRARGKGRTVAQEIMVQTKTVEQYIRDDRANALKDVIEKAGTYSARSPSTSI